MVIACTGGGADMTETRSGRYLAETVGPTGADDGDDTDATEPAFGGWPVVISGVANRPNSGTGR